MLRTRLLMVVALAAALFWPGPSSATDANCDGCVTAADIPAFLTGIFEERPLGCEPGKCVGGTIANGDIIKGLISPAGEHDLFVFTVTKPCSRPSDDPCTRTDELGEPAPCALPREGEGCEIASVSVADRTGSDLDYLCVALSRLGSLDVIGSVCEGQLQMILDAGKYLLTVSGSSTLSTRTPAYTLQYQVLPSR